jgi:hypothetical protein
MAESIQLDTKDREIVGVIADLGAASEVEIQVRTLQGLTELRSEILKMEEGGYIRRIHETLQGGYGNALMLTEKGYRSIR